MPEARDAPALKDLVAEAGKKAGATLTVTTRTEVVGGQSLCLLLTLLAVLAAVGGMGMLSWFMLNY